MGDVVEFADGYTKACCSSQSSMHIQVKTVLVICSLAASVKGPCCPKHSKSCCSHTNIVHVQGLSIWRRLLETVSRTQYICPECKYIECDIQSDLVLHLPTTRSIDNAVCKSLEGLQAWCTSPSPDVKRWCKSNENM